MITTFGIIPSETSMSSGFAARAKLDPLSGCSLDRGSGRHFLWPLRFILLGKVFLNACLQMNFGNGR